MLGVVQRLTKNGEIDGAVGERNFFDVTQFIGEVGEAVFGGEFGADFDHAGRVVDAPDLVDAAGEELGEQAFAGAEIGDSDLGGEAEGEVADGFPRAAGAIVFPELAGDEVEILLLVGAAFLEAAFEIGAVLGEFGQVGDGVAGGAEKRKGFGRQAGAEGVEGFFAFTTVDDDVGLTEQCELRGDARLGHAEDFLKFRDGKFFAEEQGQQTQAGGVGEELKRVPGGVQWTGPWGKGRTLANPQNRRTRRAD